MLDEKQIQFKELTDEVEMILCVKDNISDEEIYNFQNKFFLLTEYDIRKAIKEITGDNRYVQEFINKVNEETSNVPILKQHKLNNETTKAENTNNGKPIIDNENLVEEKSKEDNKLEIKKEINELAENKELEEENVEEIENTEIENEDLQEQKGNFIDKRTLHNKSKDKKVEQVTYNEDNIPEVSFVKAELKFGQLSFEWGWPKGIDKALLCYRMDKFPSGPKDSCASQIVVRRELGFESGDYIIQKVVEGNYYFSIYTLVEYNENTLFSEGQRRLVVNKPPSEIFYEIKIKRSLLGKLKSAELIFSTNSKEVNLPQFILIGSPGNMPLQKSDGKNLFTTDYQTIKNDKTISFNLPIENIDRNMYVKLFFLDDINSKLYRIVSPAKERLYFK